MDGAACERASTMQAAELLPKRKKKTSNLVSYFCLHAKKMLLGDPRQSDQRTQSFNFSIVNHPRPLDGTAKLKRQVFALHASLRESVRFLSGNNEH